MPERVRHEATDVHIGRVLAAAGCIALAVVLALAIAWGLAALVHGDRNGANSAAPVRVDGPVLQTAAGAELEAFRAQKREQLESYGWADRGAGRVHIPIERAMALEAKERGR